MPGENRHVLSREGGTPLIVLTGFLGSGKTKRLARYLSASDTPPTAVIVNEYGAEQVDGELIAYANDDTIVETTTGCICCSISGDVRGAVFDLKSKAQAGEVRPFDQIIVETTGLADPVSLVHALGHDDDLKLACRLDRVICVVDALMAEHWFERFEECRRQVAVADVVLVSKLDLIEDPISQRDLDQFIDRMRALNPFAVFISDASTTLADVLALDLPLSPDAGAKGKALPARHGHGPGSFSLHFDRAVDRAAMVEHVERMAARFGPNLLRVKGVASISGDDGEALVIQGVGSEVNTSVISRPPETSRLVFIVEGIASQDIAESFAALRPRFEEAVHERA